MEIRVSSRYAKSLLSLAIEQNVQYSVYNDMKFISKTCSDSKDLLLLLKSPIINTDKKLSILRSLFADKVGKLTMLFIDIITRKRREDYLDGIAREYINQYKSHKNIVTAKMTTAIKLDTNLKSKLLEIMKQNIKADIDIDENIDREIIGGFVLRVGDRQVDSSIRHQLNNLKKEFKKNPFIRE